MMNTPTTTYGPRLASAPTSLPSADPSAALAKAASMERLADLHQNEGRAWHVDRLSHLALELRCQALGVRA